MEEWNGVLQYGGMIVWVCVCFWRYGMADISHHCCSNTLHGMHHQLILYVPDGTSCSTHEYKYCMFSIQPACLQITRGVNELIVQPAVLYRGR